MRSSRLLALSGLLGLLVVGCRHESLSGNGDGDGGIDSGGADLSGGCGLVTCASAGASCGPIGDGCGGTVECGKCTAPETCGGGGTYSVCGGNSGCVPLTACPVDVNCGPYPDGCGGLVPGGCGSCTGADICGGGGPGKCGPGISSADGGIGCTPATVCPGSINCGPWGDGCGGLISGGCGGCSSPQSCGAGNPGTPGVCGGFSACVPKDCSAYPMTCGQQADGCGGLTANCGTCMGTDFCGGGGPSKCGAGTSVDAGCTGLCLLQMACVTGTTSVSGTVLAPTDAAVFGPADPINRALVYVPNGAAGAPLYGVAPFAPNVACDKCDAQVSGNPLVQVRTGVDGKFKLDNVPVMANLPLVIQIGKWRRMITVSTITPCVDNPLSADETRLPRKHTEAGTTVLGVPVLYSDIPKIGFVTGSADPMECVLRKIGIDDSDFGDPPAPVAAGTANGHRVDFFVDNGAIYSAGTPAATKLYDTQACTTVADCPSVPGQACTLNTCAKPALGLYDMVIFACVGSEVNKTATQRQNVVDYANAGGRIFNTHYSYVWLWGTPSADAFTPTATWVGDQADPTPNPLSVWLDTTFAKGMDLANWLQLTLPVASSNLTANFTAPGCGSNACTRINVTSTAGFPPVGIVQIDTEQVLYTSVSSATRLQGVTRGYNGTTAATHATGAAVTLLNPFGQIMVNDPRYNFSAVAGGATSQQWAYRNTNAPDQPSAAPYTPMHYTFNTPVGATDQCGRVVYSDFHVYTGGAGWGTCDTVPMNAQEKLIEFMLFDLTDCVTADKCVAKSCADYGYACGQWPDGCGGVTPSCGACTMPDTCGGGGTTGQCGHSSCVPLTCASLGYNCGVWGDGCGGVTANCGSCSPPEVCSGGGPPGLCGSGGCSSLDCAAQGFGCGPASDGCGNLIDCGTCPPDQSCGGGGVANQCGAPNCTPKACPMSANCGFVADGCGSVVDCGTCTPPEVCGGTGVANVCGTTTVL